MVYPQIIKVIMERFSTETHGDSVISHFDRPPNPISSANMRLTNEPLSFASTFLWQETDHCQFVAWWNTLFVSSGFHKVLFMWFHPQIQHATALMDCRKLLKNTYCRFYRTRGAGSFKEATADFWVCNGTSLQSDLSIADSSGDAIWRSENFSQSNIGRWKLWNGCNGCIS